MNLSKLLLKFFILIAIILVADNTFCQNKPRAGQKTEQKTDDKASQKPVEGISKKAKDNFTNNYFNLALEEYLTGLKQDPKNILYNYRAGICYLNTNINKE